jgi:hypothetical protein
MVFQVRPQHPAQQRGGLPEAVRVAVPGPRRERGGALRRGPPGPGQQHRQRLPAGHPLGADVWGAPDGRVLPRRLQPGSGASGRGGAPVGELRQAGGSAQPSAREGELLSRAGGLAVHDGREVKERARKPQEPQEPQEC